jgi:FMN phosphatase YigB (HAD superfamily)
MPLRAVIFDIGRVIVRVDPRRAFAALASAVSERPSPNVRPDLSPEEVWSEIQADPRWQDWQEGRMTTREWHEDVTRLLGISLGFDEFCAAWNGVLDPETILPEELFAQLGARCRLALLSNTDPLHSAFLERQFPFVRHFPVRVYSCSIAASKPSPAIYRATLERLGLAPAEAVYIDDIAEYAEAARRLGMDAIRFENPAQLRVELVRRQLLT